MQVRPLMASDIPILEDIARTAGYPYPDLSDARNIEAVRVVVDETGEPLAACAAERIVQLYFWSKDLPPASKLHAIRLLHESLSAELRKLNYNEANCAIPPQIEKSFGSRLMRSFGWVKQWPVWAVRF